MLKGRLKDEMMEFHAFSNNQATTLAWLETGTPLKVWHIEKELPLLNSLNATSISTNNIIKYPAM